MGTVTLVSGFTAVRKNGVPAGSAIPMTLTFDEDLGIFKVILINGNIWTTFYPNQVTSVSTSMTGGWLSKTYLFQIGVKFSNGDDYGFSYNVGAIGQAENAKVWVNGYIQRNAAMNEIITRMRTRERVPLSEATSILTKYGLPASDEEARKVVEQGITKSGIDGVLDDTGFVGRSALNREQVRYDIVTKFEVGKDGAVVLSCPKCGASIPIESKEQSNVCKYCGASYTVPRNILKLL